MDVTNMLLGHVPSFCSTGATDEWQELFPLFRSPAFSWSAEERDSWEYSRDLGVHSPVWEQGRTVCTWAFLWFSISVFTFSVELNHRWGCYQGKWLLGAKKALPEHCQRVKSEGWLVGGKEGHTAFLTVQERVNDEAVVRFSATACMNLMAGLRDTLIFHCM